MAGMGLGGEPSVALSAIDLDVDTEDGKGPDAVASSDLSGVVKSGRGLAAGLLADPVILQRLEELAGFPVVPGTLNLRLAEPLETHNRWRYLHAAEIDVAWQDRTGQAGYFLTPVTVAGRYRGLAFQADEPAAPGYPSDQIELFCEVVLRTALDLRDGDRVVVTLRET